MSEILTQVSFENAGTEFLDAGIAIFGQVFSRGELSSGTQLTAKIDDEVLVVQVDVKTTYDDGSIKMAVLSIERPGIAPGVTIEATLQAATQSAAASAVDLAAALHQHDFTVDLGINGVSTRIDVLEALQAALSDGSATYWQAGPLASQARVIIDLPGSQRLVFDVTAFKGGGLKVDAQFNNDDAMQAQGGRVTYELVATLDGQVVAQEAVSQGQYQNWHESFSTTNHDGGQGLGGAESGWLNIRHDIAHLQTTGAVAHYDLSNGVAESLLAKWQAVYNSAGWNDPLSTRSITEFMPGTGGRDDIGITTAANTGWLISQDIRAATYALGQAEGASSVPWNFWDTANNKWLSAEDYPQLWTDGRGGTGTPGDSGSRGLTQQMDGQTGWTLDSAHQPDLSYVPYLLTGERWMLDNLQAQGSWNVINTWDVARGPEGLIVVKGGQVRHSAWALRQIDEAAWASPDGSVEKAYFTAASNANWAWLVEQIPAWTAAQGEAHGWVPGHYGTDGALPPWQQDYFASTAIAAAAKGNADALTFLEWQSNFLIGRFTHDAQGFEQHDGAAYLIAISDPSTRVAYQSWAEIGVQTQARGWSNGDGWDRSQGDYGQLALATLAGIAHLTGSPAAIDAYNALLAEAPPFTTAEVFKSNPGLSITLPGGRPNLPVDPFPTLPEPPVPADPPPTDAPQSSVALSIVLGGEIGPDQTEALVRVNGVQAFHGMITANHATGGIAIDLGHHAAGQQHTVTVEYLNDGWGDNGDRNLYVNDILVGGVSTGSSGVLLWNSSVDFAVTAPIEVPEPPVPADPPPTDAPQSSVALSIVLGGEIGPDQTEALVRVNGVQAFHGMITANHATGGIAIDLGHHAAGQQHTVTVEYLNDGWGDNGDRNLYVNDILVGGVSTGSSGALLWNSSVDFTVTAGTTASVPTFGSGAHVVRLGLSQDVWQGNALYSVLIDGKEIVVERPVTADHAAGTVDYIDLRTDLASASPEVTVRFLNDAWGGSDADRNLRIESVTLDGVDLRQQAVLMTQGDATFTLPTAATAGQGGSQLVRVGLSQDAWGEDARFSIKLDGKTILSNETLSAERTKGEVAYVDVYTDHRPSAAGEHTLTVSFLNDAVGVDGPQDRNIHIESISVDGVDQHQSAFLPWSGDAVFTI